MQALGVWHFAGSTFRRRLNIVCTHPLLKLMAHFGLEVYCLTSECRGWFTALSILIGISTRYHISTTFRSQVTNRDVTDGQNADIHTECNAALNATREWEGLHSETTVNTEMNAASK